MSDAAQEPISDQRIKYDQIRARVLAGKASQQEAADAIKKLCEDNERLAMIAGKTRADLDAARAELATVKAERDIQECLYDSVFQSGVKLGWNFGVTGDEAGLKAATSSTEHVAEIKRIRAALQSTPAQKEQSDE